VEMPAIGCKDTAAPAEKGACQLSSSTRPPIDLFRGFDHVRERTPRPPRAARFAPDSGRPFPLSFAGTDARAPNPLRGAAMPGGQYRGPLAPVTQGPISSVQQCKKPPLDF